MGTAEDSTQSLLVKFSNEKGDEIAEYDFARLPCSRKMQSELARAFRYQNSTLGTWREVASCIGALNNVRAFVRWCTSDGQIDSLSELDPFTWIKWVAYSETRWAAATNACRTGTLATLFRALPDINRDVRTLTRTTRFEVKPVAVTASYTRLEQARMRSALTKQVRRTVERIETNLALLGQDGRSRSLASRFIRELIVTGRASAPLPSGVVTKPTLNSAGRPRGPVFHAVARTAVFMTRDEAVACAALLIAHFGYNPSTVARLTITSDAANLGGKTQVVTLHSRKPRRGKGNQHHPTNLDGIKRGTEAEAVSLIRRATEPGRQALAQAGMPTDRLLVYTQLGSYRLEVGDIPNILRLKKQGELGWWPSQLPSLAYDRLHRSFQTTYKVSPVHNSTTTHQKDYLETDAGFIATHKGRMVGFQGLVAEAHASRMALAVVDSVEVENDTALAGCLDVLHHPGTGKTCALLSFWLCLECPLAVAAPRHFPRLGLLVHEMEVLRPLLPRQWDRYYAPKHAFIRGLLADNVSPEEFGQLRHDATEDDADFVRMLLDESNRHNGFEIAA